MPAPAERVEGSIVSPYLVSVRCIVNSIVNWFQQQHIPGGYKMLFFQKVRSNWVLQDLEPELGPLSSGIKTLSLPIWRNSGVICCQE